MSTTGDGPAEGNPEPRDPWASPGTRGGPAVDPWAGWGPGSVAPRREPLPWPPPGMGFTELMRLRARWWRPLLGLLFAPVALIAFGVPILLGAAAVQYLRNGGPFDDTSLQPDDPIGLLANNLLLAALIPASLLAVLLVHRLRPRFLMSVEGGLRWRLLPRLLLAALVVAGAFTVVTLPFAPLDTNDAGSAGHVAAMLAVVLISTPVQAAGEEFFFRGYLIQSFASWFASPRTGALVAGGISSVLFALAHGTQGPALFIDRLVFGLVAAWLVWRTGGLEAGMALHVVNNLVSLALAVVTGAVSSALEPGDVGVLAALLDMTMMVTYAYVVHRWLARRGARTTGEPAVVAQ